MPVPEEVNLERGQLVDMISDMHQYFYRKKVALVGDPDQLISLAEFLADHRHAPRVRRHRHPRQALREEDQGSSQPACPLTSMSRSTADMFLLHQWIKNEPVDLLIGNTYGKYIARDEDIPLVRCGFPILDRVGHQYFPTVGYKGGIRLLEKILGAPARPQGPRRPRAELRAGALREAGFKGRRGQGSK